MSPRRRRAPHPRARTSTRRIEHGMVEAPHRHLPTHRRSRAAAIPGADPRPRTAHAVRRRRGGNRRGGDPGRRAHGDRRRYGQRSRRRGHRRRHAGHCRQRGQRPASGVHRQPAHRLPDAARRDPGRCGGRGARRCRQRAGANGAVGRKPPGLQRHPSGRPRQQRRAATGRPAAAGKHPGRTAAAARAAGGGAERGRRHPALRLRRGRQPGRQLRYRPGRGHRRRHRRLDRRHRQRLARRRLGAGIPQRHGRNRAGAGCRAAGRGGHSPRLAEQRAPGSDLDPLARQLLARLHPGGQRPAGGGRPGRPLPPSGRPEYPRPFHRQRRRHRSRQLRPDRDQLLQIQCRGHRHLHGDRLQAGRRHRHHQLHHH